VRHRNLTNYAHFITERLELARFPEGLHFATVSTIGADLGNTCIFPALISGGCLHIIAYEDCTDAQRFARYAQRYGSMCSRSCPRTCRPCSAARRRASCCPESI